MEFQEKTKIQIENVKDQIDNPGKVIISTN